VNHTARHVDDITWPEGVLDAVDDERDLTAQP
jgi:hypothetical protein